MPSPVLEGKDESVCETDADCTATPCQVPISTMALNPELRFPSSPEEI